LFALEDEHCFSSQEQYRSVVKVFNVMSTPNYLMPWQNKPHRDSTGSGFAIEGRRIITNAHVVADSKHCQVRKHGEASKFTASVVGVSHECDLAMLTVEDDAFWEDLHPLELGGIPELQEAVTVVGYPTGGDNISVTGGVVSRVDFQQYAHGASNLLAVQIDAAINPGNSGGPAMLNGQVAGVAFQNLIGAENIGFIIPTNIVRHFLEEIEERGECSFVSLGVLCQPLDSPSLREYLGLHEYSEHNSNGVLVNKVMPLSSASDVLQSKDVLLAFNGEPIGCDGTVHFRGHERTSFDWLVTAGKVGEVARLLILRERQEQEVVVTLSAGKQLVPVHQYDQLPSYFIVAGFVFSRLTQPYLHEFGDDW
jgi:S1-C subfamily serine protease